MRMWYLRLKKATRWQIAWFIPILLCISVASCSGGDSGGTGTLKPTAVASTGKNVGLFLVAGSIGGAGNLDGTGAAARFDDPAGIAADAAGNLYVADFHSSTIRKITAAGDVTTLSGTAGVAGFRDGSVATALFNHPVGIVVDAAGNLIVADTGNGRIRKITAAGLVTTLAGNGQCGSADGTGTAAQFCTPGGIAVDAAGNMFVTDGFNENIREVTPAGVVTTLAGVARVFGSQDGPAAQALFSGPRGIAVDPIGNLYVADSQNYTIRKITPNGFVSTLAGTAGVAGSQDGSAAVALFNLPGLIALDTAGNLYVSDEANNTIRKISSAGVVTTLAGTAGLSGSADGVGANARFHGPGGIALDSAGTLYVTDELNNTIRKIAGADVVTTVAGLAVVSGTADGSGAAAQFNNPFGVAADPAGNLYVADTNNHTIRKITKDGAVTTLAGTAGMSGNADGIGAAARFNSPQGLTADSAGNLYVADTGNQSVRKITKQGVVTTLAVVARYEGFNGTLIGITVDSAGNVYVTDGVGVLYKITSAGVATALVGAPGLLIIEPAGVAVDAAGNLFVADAGHNTIDMVTPAGVVTVLAGLNDNTLGRGSVDGIGAAARFNNPLGIAVGHDGNLYVADAGNRTIRKIVTATAAVTTVAGVANQFGVRLGSLPGSLSIPAGLTVLGNSSLALTMGLSMPNEPLANCVLSLVLPNSSDDTSTP